METPEQRVKSVQSSQSKNQNAVHNVILTFLIVMFEHISHIVFILEFEQLNIGRVGRYQTSINSDFQKFPLTISQHFLFKVIIHIIQVVVLII